MLNQEYRREMDQLTLGDDLRRRLVTAMGEETPKHHSIRWPLRTVLVAAAVCALLVGSALALSPTLRDILQCALGAFSPYAQDLAEHEVSCTDQGIEVRVVSALSDGNTIVIYFEAQDQTEDRLDEFTNTNTQILWPQGVEWKQGTLFTAEQIAYDKESRTALYRTKFIGDGIPASDLTVPLYGQVFSPDFHILDPQTIVHGEQIWGEWRLDVPLEPQTASVISMAQSGTGLAIGPSAIQMFLSPISVTIECDPQGGSGSLGYPLTLFHADGTVTSEISCDSNYFSGSYATNHWTLPQPIDPDTVTAIAIGQWYIPLENGAAQRGHWLSAVPSPAE